MLAGDRHRSFTRAAMCASVSSFTASDGNARKSAAAVLRGPKCCLITVIKIHSRVAPRARRKSQAGREGKDVMTVKEFIDIFGLQLRSRKNGETVYERLHGDVEYRHVLWTLPPGCVRVEAWETRQRAVWTCDAQWCVITLVEGDLTVALYHNEAQYRRGLEDTARFHAEHG
jgi:hypothetical protein